MTIDLDEGAGIGGWDIRAVRHALCAVMRRRPEAYHETLREHDAAAANAGSRAGAGGAPDLDPRDGPSKETGPRRPAVLRPVSSGAPGWSASSSPARRAEAWETAQAIELGDAVDGRLRRSRASRPTGSSSRREATVVERRAASAASCVTKEIAARRRPALADPAADGHGRQNRSTEPIDAILGIEWTLMMLGGGGNPSAWWEVDGAADRPRRARHGRRRDGVRPGQRPRRDLGRHRPSPSPPTLWWAPVETVSNSEGGFERVYQGSGLLVSWPLALPPAASHGP